MAAQDTCEPIVLNYNFEKVTSMKRGSSKSSKSRQIGNFSWILKLELGSDAKEFWISVACKRKGDIAEVDAEVKFKLFCPSDLVNPLVETKNKHLNCSNSSNYYYVSMPMSSSEIEKYLSRGNELNVEAIVTIKTSDDEKVKRSSDEQGVEVKKDVDIKEEVDIKQEITDDNDEAVLKVGNKSFPISKKMFAKESKYFEGMFNGAPNSEYTLNDVEPGQFKLLLDCLNGKKKVDEKNFEDLLTVSNKYAVIKIKGQCEQFLLEGLKTILEENMEIADKYGLGNMKAVCASNIKSADDALATLFGELALK